MALTQAAERAALNKVIDYLDEDPEKNIDTIMTLVDKFVPEYVLPSQRRAFDTAIRERNNWYRLMMRIFDLNPEVRTKLLKTLIVDCSVLAWPQQERMREKHQCNIPYAILLDPTSACNLRCTGCWAAEYGHALNLSFEDIDSIICQGKELGCHIYIYTGGEPLVRKDDLIRLCEKHQNCAFLCFTNATLIDEAFCQEMIRVKNFVPAISAEGDEASTDSRRGEGTYQKVDEAMDLLRSHGLPFGVSICYTSVNSDSVTSEEYIDWLIDKGALFAWIFTYMPVGKDSPTDLMPTPEQREKLYLFNDKMRQTKPLFTLDFQHDGEYVGGCIAGGRRYLHINAAGDVEPCVFIHYSNANIHDSTLLDCLRSPIFMEYYHEQPFNDNYMRPCPMLENPECLEYMVAESGAHSTDLVAQESAEELCAKTKPAAEAWAPVAERLWTDKEGPRVKNRERDNIGMAETDIAKFKKDGRVIRGAWDPERDPRSAIAQKTEASK
mgnify:CR=1 FL=1